ncbi:hypothetical protein E4U53_003621, partial [Claviceps sorghi]
RRASNVLSSLSSITASAAASPARRVPRTTENFILKRTKGLAIDGGKRARALN